MKLRAYKFLMCGIAAFFAKDSSHENCLGELFSPMLGGLSSRGPDSAGFALYRNPAPAGCLKIVLQSPNPDFSWAQLCQTLSAKVGPVRSHDIVSTHCIAHVQAG